jgi:hypothetical protein
MTKSMFHKQCVWITRQLVLASGAQSALKINKIKSMLLNENFDLKLEIEGVIAVL